MNKGPHQEAESINDILQTAYVQQQSGLLNLERMHQGHREIGDLYVLAGQPIYARVEKRSGQEALEYMLTWYAIRFSFVADAPRPPANLSSRIRISPPVASLSPLYLPPPGPSTARASAGPTASGERAPQKVGLGHHAFLPSLTRRQRLIYLLIDGQRTTADLSRCSGKTPMEVETILYELQQIGLVAFFTSE